MLIQSVGLGGGGGSYCTFASKRVKCQESQQKLIRKLTATRRSQRKLEEAERSQQKLKEAERSEQKT